MSPLDDELRSLLSARADDVRPAPDTLTGVADRARSLRRRRSGAMALGSVAAVLAVAVAVPTGLSALDRTGAGPSGLAGGATPSPAPVTRPADGGLDWPVQGDAGLARSMAQSVAAATPGSLPGFDAATDLRVVPLYAAENDVATVFLGEALATGQPPTLVYVIDAGEQDGLILTTPTPPGTVQVSADVPGDDGARELLVIGDPAVVERVFYTPPGGDDGLDLGGSPAVLSFDGPVPDGATVEVAGADGASLYNGPLTFSPADAAPVPGSPVVWGAGEFGSVAQQSGQALRERWTAAHPGRRIVALQFLVCCAAGPDPTVELSQIVDDQNVTWDHATLTAGTDTQVLLDAPALVDRTHFALEYTRSPESGPQVMVVTDPAVTEVAFSADGQDFTAVARDPQFPATDDGRAPAVYRFPRTSTPAEEALRITGADGEVLYLGPVT